MPLDLDHLESRDLIWRPGQHRAPVKKTGVSTGFAALDVALREGGWPRGALTEVLMDRPGVGELRLLLPALAQLSIEKRYQLWIGEPWVPFAPGLQAAGIDLNQIIFVHPHNHQQWLWAAEQALRSPGCGAVIAWANNSKSRYAELRKLQVAVAERSGIGFILTASRYAATASPAALRLQLTANIDGLDIHILKQRGASAGQSVHIDLPFQLQKQLPLRKRPAVSSRPSDYAISTLRVPPLLHVEMLQ
jgi:cell division inhibitor SulA/protein ImuA